MNSRHINAFAVLLLESTATYICCIRRLSSLVSLATAPGYSSTPSDSHSSLHMLSCVFWARSFPLMGTSRGRPSLAPRGTRTQTASHVGQMHHGLNGVLPPHWCSSLPRLDSLCGNNTWRLQSSGLFLDLDNAASTGRESFTVNYLMDFVITLLNV